MLPARFDNTGKVSRENAEKIGLVGYAGRASGLDYDARVSFPTECYGELPANSNAKPMAMFTARAMVRREEIMHSTSLIISLLDKKEEAKPFTPAHELQLASHSFVVSINEGWRGEISHCILTDDKGESCATK